MFYVVLINPLLLPLFYLALNGVFHLVCCWWMWGVVLGTLGSDGLPDDVMPVSTL